MPQVSYVGHPKGLPIKTLYHTQQHVFGTLCATNDAEKLFYMCFKEWGFYIGTVSCNPAKHFSYYDPKCTQLRGSHKSL